MKEFIINNAATIATIGFFMAFCYIFFVTMRKKNKKKFEDCAKIPFEDEQK